RASLPLLHPKLHSSVVHERGQAVRAIATLDAAELSPELLELLKTESDRYVRYALLYTLAKFNYKPALPVIQSLLTDVDPDIRSSAAEAFGKIEGTKASLQLRTLMQWDANFFVRHAIAKILNDIESR